MGEHHFNVGCVMVLVCYFMVSYVVSPTSISSTGLHKDEYEIIFERIEKVYENRSCVNFSNLKISKYNRTTTVLNGTYEYLVNITNDMLLNLTAYEQYGAYYRRSIISFSNIRYCEYVINNNKLSTGYSSSHTTNMTMSCPIPRGVYYVLNYQLDERHYLSVVPREGKWRLDSVAYQNGTPCFHFRIYYRYQRRRSAIAAGPAVSYSSR